MLIPLRAMLGNLAVFSAVAAAVAQTAVEDQHAQHTNRLINATSPYLLQHAHNPVNWYEWSDAAFERAKAEDKPIFLSIGYAACHWCHVMERESFENEEIAKIMNENFIAIKVDREERPDVDEIYMAATFAMTGRGGWPMSVFMTPDREPFFCGTYFPPNNRGGRPGFRSILKRFADQWRNDRTALDRTAAELVQKVKQRKRVIRGQTLIEREAVSGVVSRIASGFDPKLGGRRSARNKFPPCSAMELMLREYSMRGAAADPKLLALVELTLSKMADGGIYDHIGGGICRYSTDPRWFAPHFEKMLYDQATVSGAALSAYQITHNEKYADFARGILDYCLEDFQSPAGGFYSSRDADSEGEEGKFYTWTQAELEQILGAEDAKLFGAFYGVTERGNWHRGQNILHKKFSIATFATGQGLEASVLRMRLDRMRARVKQVRSERVPPALDDKILVEWNGLLITSLARASRILDEPRYRDAAARAGIFILKDMMIDGRLYRAHRAGKTHIAAYSADYACLIEALITLYETTFDRRWLTAADTLTKSFIAHYHDAKLGGFFYTADDAEKLLMRSKHIRDSVVPSANSVAALNLLRLAILLDRPEYRSLAEETMIAAGRQIAGLDRMQWAVLFSYGRPKEIAIIGEPGDVATKSLLDAVYAMYLPNKVVALGRPKDAQQSDALPLLGRRTLIDNRPAAYVCEDYVCKRPVTTAEELRALLTARD